MKEMEKKTSVGARIIQGLQDFVDTLEKKKPVAEEFNCRVVELDLQPTAYSPELVRETRRKLRASQAVLALLLGVSVKTVRSWEQGVNTPSDMACRFLDEIRFNPDYWIGRLQDSAVSK